MIAGAVAHTEPPFGAQTGSEANPKPDGESSGGWVPVGGSHLEA